MKVVISFIMFILCVGGMAVGQDVHQDTAKYNKDSLIKRFSQKGGNLDFQCDSSHFLTGKGFSEITKQIFSRVVVKNDDLVKNGTASSLVIDGDKATISGNANIKLGDYSFLNLGVAGNTESKQLNLFKNGGYSKGFTLSGGWDFKLRPFQAKLLKKVLYFFPSSLFYNPEPCKKLKEDRLYYYRNLYAKLNALCKVDSNDINNRINVLKSILFSSQVGDESPEKLDSLMKLYNKETDSLNLFRRYLSDKHSQDTAFDTDLAEFEVKNAVSTGYTLHWGNFSGSFSNQSYNIFDTSLTNSIKDTLKNDHFQIFNIQASYNYVHSGPKVLLYATLGIAFQRQFGLQDFKYSGQKLIGGSTAIVETNNVEAINVSEIHESYNKPYWATSPQFGMFMFFGKKKVAGFELFASLNLKMKTPDLIEYRPSGSFRFGPLFSMSQSGGVVSSGTIALLLTANNMVFAKNNLNDVLGFSVRLGIPFSNVKAL